MRERYQEKLKQIQGELLDMGMLCETAIQKTCRLLLSSQEKEKQIEEISRLEKEIDGKEQVIESACIQLLLRQQPVAADLRYISAALKMITDLERIGDQAIDIAEILQTGSITVPVKGVRITEMAEFTMRMVNESMDSFIKKDLFLAQKVIDSDDALDELFLIVRKSLNEKTAQGELTSDQALDLLMIAKYYERIGDHATNIGEWVEFSLTGIHRSGKEVNNVFDLNK